MVGGVAPLGAVESNAPDIVVGGASSATSIADQSTTSSLTFNGPVTTGTLSMAVNPVATSLNLFDGATFSTDFGPNHAALTMGGVFTFTSTYTGSLNVNQPITISGTGDLIGGDDQRGNGDRPSTVKSGRAGLYDHRGDQSRGDQRGPGRDRRPRRRTIDAGHVSLAPLRDRRRYCRAYNPDRSGYGKRRCGRRDIREFDRWGFRTDNSKFRCYQLCRCGRRNRAVGEPRR